MTTPSNQVLQRIWQSLQEATTRSTGMTLSFLGTVGLDGGPRVRGIILRKFQEDPQRLYFATHIHSDKVAEIHRTPQVALTGNDSEHNVQLRIEGHARIVKDPVLRQHAWESLAPHSQQLYASASVPGAPDDAAPQDHESSAFDRFTWVEIECERLDWLDLSAEPQERWKFSRDANTWHGQRIVP